VGVPTHAFWPMIENDPALVHGLTETPRLVVFGGGVPVKVAGSLVGAVGVSGGSADQDREVAEAGAAGL
jgi:glc operon protein GlcG